MVAGAKVREMLDKTNDFEQAGLRWNSFDKERQDRFVKRVSDNMMDKKLNGVIKDIW